MKVVVRRRTGGGLVVPEDLPARVQATIRHWGTGEEYEQALEFGMNASATWSFQLPESAPLGDYSVEVELDEISHESASFKVERFKVGAMRATVGGPEEPLVRPRSVPVSVSRRTPVRRWCGLPCR